MIDKRSGGAGFLPQTVVRKCFGMGAGGTSVHSLGLSLDLRPLTF